jgi:hypothetical protein
MMKQYRVMVFNKWENSTSFERVTAHNAEEAHRIAQSSNRGMDITIVGELN